MAMSWYNGYGDAYGIVNKVTRHKRTQCRACKEGNEGGVENPEHVVEIIANGGPTGKLMLCKPHAMELSQMIADAANEID